MMLVKSHQDRFNSSVVITHVTREHKTSHEGQFCQIEIYASSESWKLILSLSFVSVCVCVRVCVCKRQCVCVCERDSVCESVCV